METMALMGMNVAQLIVDEFNELLIEEEKIEAGVQKVMVEEDFVTPDEL